MIIMCIDISRFSTGKIATGYICIKRLLTIPSLAFIIKRFFTLLPLRSPTEDSALARATTTLNLVFIKLELVPPLLLLASLIPHAFAPPPFSFFRFAFSRKLAEEVRGGGGEAGPLTSNRNRYAEPASQRKLARASDDSTMPLIIIRHWRNTWRARGPICRHVFTRSMGFRRWRAAKGLGVRQFRCDFI